jgi:dimethylglycine dehydrogenase
MLNARGKLIGDFTVASAEKGFYVFGSGAAEQYHMRWFEAQLPDDGSVRIRPLSAELLGFSIAGPRSRELLARLTDVDVTSEKFRFRDFRRLEVGRVPAMVGRISFTGDLGYEIWVRADFFLNLYDRLVEAGEDLGLRHFGARAFNSLRLEKSFGTWAREYRPIYGPHEAGLDRFVSLTKGNFLGREAVLRESEKKRRLVTLVVDDADVDVMGDEPVWHEGEVRGWVTSGGFCHFAQKSVALAYIPATLADAGPDQLFEIEILGDRRPAVLQPTPLFDPEGHRMRG